MSVRREKVMSRRRVRMCVKGGESIRSEVSSSRRRRVGVMGMERGGEVVLGLGEDEEDEEGGVLVMPDSWRTRDSSERGGRR